MASAHGCDLARQIETIEGICRVLVYTKVLAYAKALVHVCRKTYFNGIKCVFNNKNSNIYLIL